MTAIAKEWAALLEAARDVPAEGEERASWTVRGLAEVALMMHVANGPWHLLDATVAATTLDGADIRFAERLGSLRRWHGSVPTSYHYRTTRPPRPAIADAAIQAAAVALLKFAKSLPTPEVDSATPLSPRDGVGRHVVHSNARRRSCRGCPSEGVYYLDIDIPAELLWRAWAVLPGVGITRIVPQETLQPAQMTVWWGVHDGCHLDHLLAADPMTRTGIQFGHGLLAAEALAMVSEIVAGAEAALAGESSVAGQVRDGLIERVGRFDTKVGSTEFTRLSAELDVPVELEFASLPILASAYVAGPLRLIGTNFTSSSIPDRLAEDFRQRWKRLTGQSAAAHDLDTAAHTTFG